MSHTITIVVVVVIRVYIEAKGQIPKVSKERGVPIQIPKWEGKLNSEKEY